MAEILVNDIGIESKPVGFSELGSVVYDNIIFPAPANGAYNEIVLNAAQIDISRQSDIVFSRVNGKNGTIKEYTGKGDYNVNLSIIIAAPLFSATGLLGIAAQKALVATTANRFAGLVNVQPDVTDTETLNEIVKLEKVQGAIEIENKFLNNRFGLKKFVIQSFDVKRQVNDYILTISLLSDTPIDFGDFGADRQGGEGVRANV